MYRKSLLIIISSMFMVSCGTSKNVASTYHKIPEQKKSVAPNAVTIADKIIWTAVTYKGIPYKYGGMSNSGMDCSGLIHTSFKQRNIALPRTSREMYAKGYAISLQQVKRGDLLFFRTSRKQGYINHVGLVTSANSGNIRFIHATSSKGVIITSLDERYWKRAFIAAKRVL